MASPQRACFRWLLVSLALLSLSSCSAILESMVDSAFDSDNDHSSGDARQFGHGKARSGVDHANTGDR